MIEILYEDEDIVIVNKQSGLAVQGGQGISCSLDNLLSEQMNQKMHLVHRLDRDTAGILVVAKNPRAANLYTSLLSEKSGNGVVKEYSAICVGLPEQNSGKIADDISSKGIVKKAFTSYKVVSKSNVVVLDQNLDFSLLNLVLGTGRMHQIRIHLNKINVPIILDDKYGNFKINKILKKAFGAKKLQLAATKLSLPIQGKIKTFAIELPEHMEKLRIDLSL